jgi:hypothetical protein
MQRVMFQYECKWHPGTDLDTGKSDYKYRLIRPDDICRHQLEFRESHGDIYIKLEFIRNMTKEEEEKFPYVDDDPNMRRIPCYLSYYAGDIVKVYNDEVNYEQNTCVLGIVRHRDEVKIKGKPNDIGIVLTNGEENEYWRKIYCWKAGIIKSVQCDHLYWISDANGRALRIKNAKERLEEDAPLKILKEYKPHFEKWL